MPNSSPPVGFRRKPRTPTAKKAIPNTEATDLTIRQTVPADGVLGRLEAAVGVLNKLGGLAELEERDGYFVIRGYSCPLGSVASEHPEVCRMTEILLTELAGVPVYEHCDRSERARCCFEVAIDGDVLRER